jgi:hypothetical protein
MEISMPIILQQAIENDAAARTTQSHEHLASVATSAWVDGQLSTDALDEILYSAARTEIQ